MCYHTHVDPTPDPPPHPAPVPWGVPAAPAPPPPPPSGPRRSRWLVAIIGISIVGLAVGGYLLARDDARTSTSASLDGGPSEPPDHTPVDVTDLQAKPTSFEVTLRWRPGDGDPQPAALNVYRDGELLDSVGAGTTTFVDDTVLPGSIYLYDVVAVDATDAEFPLGAPSVRVRTKPAAPSTARLEGVFNARFTETDRFGYSSSTGKLLTTLGFRFEPRCANGPCTTDLSGLRFPGFRIDLKLSGGVYRGSVSGLRFARCGNVSVSSTVTVSVEPTMARGIDGVWRVTQATGTLAERSPSQLGCRSSGSDHTFTAKLV